MRVTPLAAMLLVSLTFASPALAADAAEIAFWESVRDSKDAGELRAYLERYPNGDFAVLARRRLAALDKPPAASAPQLQTSPPPKMAPVAGTPHKLQVGDSWTYRLSYPRLRGQWGQPDRPSTLQVVTLSALEGNRIVDAVAVDGGSSLSVTHEPTPTLLPQGTSIFSPYLPALEKLPGSKWFRSVVNSEPNCARRFICDAKARATGSEPVQVPAGSFLATKVIVEEEWRGGSVAAPRFTGGRILTVWYAPEIGRAIKYQSRMTVGDVTPVEANFDLELVSYKLK